MRSPVLAVLKFLLPAFAAALLLACESHQDHGLLIRNVNVVDVEARRILYGQDLLIQDGRIAEIGAQGSLPLPDQVFDAQGAFATAGLYDAHTHIDTAQRLELMLPELVGLSVSSDEIDDDLAAYMVYGVTGIVVFNGLDGVLEARQRAEADGAFLPRILTAGPILDAPDSQNPLHRKIAGPEQGTAAVNDAAAAGYDFIKTYHIGDVATRNAIIARAKALGLPVAGHIPPGMAFEDALVPGFTNVAHAEEITRMWDGEDPGYFARAIGLMATHHITLTPNLVAYREIAGQLDDIERHLAALDWALTPPLARVYASPPFNGYVEDFGAEDRRERALAYFRRTSDVMDGLTRDAFAAGIPLLAGSDTGNPTMLPGQGLYRELALLQGAGLDGYDAIAAATLNVARLFGEDAERGSIAPGKIADIVLFDSNPVDGNPMDRLNVAAVIRHGVVFDRAHIARKVERISANYDRREARYLKAAEDTSKK